MGRQLYDLTSLLTTTKLRPCLTGWGVPLPSASRTSAVGFGLRLPGVGYHGLSDSDSARAVNCARTSAGNGSTAAARR